jgi:hypothetical protein
MFVNVVNGLVLIPLKIHEKLPIASYFEILSGRQ